MTPRRRSTVRTPADPGAPKGPQGAQGKMGAPGERGFPGPSVFREISEASSTELYGTHAGFLVPAVGQPPLECSFLEWEDGDVLQLDYWLQIPLRERGAFFQAQVSLDAGQTWQGVSGARVFLLTSVTSVSASISVPLPNRPLVRLYTSGVDCGPGPEGGTVVLRCTRWTAGTFRAGGRLIPPLTGA